MVIAAFAGTGKTTLAKLYPQKVVDFVAMPFKYYMDDEENSDFEGEKNKANPNLVMRPDWPENYFEAISNALCNNKILLIPSDWQVLIHLHVEGIPYYLCHPQRDAKEVYRKRYINRGNSEEFLKIFIDGWDCFMNMLEVDMHGQRIIMQPDQFLSDVIDVDALYEELQSGKEKKYGSETHS